MHELPLVFFTVLGQTSVGLFLLAFLAAKCGSLTEQQLKNANLVAIVLMAIGMAIGGLHMGKPLRSMNLIFGAIRSPMSNEILLSGAFFGAAAATVGLGFKNVQLFIRSKFGITAEKLEGLAKLANIAAVVLGLAFAWSITQVYQLATVPAWNTGFTTLQLWLTVAVAGGAFAMAMGAHKLGGIAVIAGGAASLAMRPGYIDFVTDAVPHLAIQQHTLWTAHAATVVAALLVAMITLVGKRRIAPVVFGGAAVILVGELVSRIAFYNLWWITM